mmetsp:Transcript_80903/g.140562  ORF Transcript_80903/g.140562 Transcript_80903/m.140562 type:complete len:123 (-) Transcript_80903:19-387(-)
MMQMQLQRALGQSRRAPSVKIAHTMVVAAGGGDLVACSPKVNKCAKGKVDDRCNGRPNGYRVDSWSGVCYEGRIDLECPRMLANESTNACEIKFPYDLSGAQRLCMTSSTALLATAFVSTMV